MSTYTMTLFILSIQTFVIQLSNALDKSKIQKKLGKRIIKLRESKNITQSELARLCFKDRQSIERVENGKTNPTINYLLDIAEALNVTLKELMDFG